MQSEVRIASLLSIAARCGCAGILTRLYTGSSFALPQIKEERENSVDNLVSIGCEGAVGSSALCRNERGYEKQNLPLRPAKQRKRSYATNLC